MKLLHLDVEQFGIFGNREFPFDGGFQLIYGPNEAGKTTLLQLVRDVLFGFPTRSPYALANHTGQLAATVTAELSRGERIRFRRHKGRQNTVVGEVKATGEVIDEAVLARLLGGANEQLYRHVFGFSLVELASGEASLQEANLAEALFGTGIGNLANFQRVEQTLADEIRMLYTPRGSKPTINRALAAIREQTKQLRELAVKPADYDELRGECSASEAEAARLAGEVQRLREESQRLERLATALHRWPLLVAAENELANLPEGPSNLPTSEFARGLAAQLAEATAEVQRLDGETGRLGARRESIQFSPAILAAEPAIRELLQQVGRVQRFRHDIPLRQQEATTIRNEVLARLRGLNPEWSFEHLERFRTGLAHREAVQQMADEFTELTRRFAELTAQRPELEQQLVRTREQLTELESVQRQPVLEALWDRAVRYQADRVQFAELDREATALQEDCRTLERSLSSRMKTTSIGPRVPEPTAVAEFRDRFSDARQALRHAERQVETAQKELTRQHEELSRLDAMQSAPSREQLAAQRTRRDDLWRRLRQKLADGQDAAADCEPFELELALADSLADERQSKAEVVAKREQLVELRERQKTRLSEAIELQTKRTFELAEVERQWKELWRETQVEPLSPEAMLPWLRDHAQLTSKQQQVTARLARRDKLQAESLMPFETELRAAIAGLNGDWEASLNELRRRVEAGRAAGGARRQLQSLLPQQQEKLSLLDQELADVSRRRDDWQRRWKATLSECGFPADWTVQTAAKILGSLAESRQRHHDAVTLDERVAAMQRETAEFEQLVSATAAELQVAPSSRAEDTVVELDQRLQAAKAAALQQRSLAEQVENSRRLAEAKRQQCERLQRQLDELFTAAGTASVDEYCRVAEAAAKAAELRDRVANLSRELDAICGAVDRESFFAALREADPAALARRRQTLDAELARAESDHETAVRRAAVCRAKFDALDSESQATSLALQLESSRAELSNAVDRWAPLVLAQTMLARAIQKFEREQQPRMLEDVSRLFSRMTLGRYKGLQRKLDESGSLVVLQPDGTTKELSQLSTGTREQLYLAIRLAYVQQYCRHSEPLPLVMDDVLVNFDEQRVEGTLAVLFEISQSMQILFLTCHQRVVDMIRIARPEIKPLNLAASPSSGTWDDPFAPPRVTSTTAKSKPPRPKLVPAGDAQGLLFPSG